MVVSTHWWLIPSFVVLEKAISVNPLPVIVISSPPVVQPFDGETTQLDVSVDDFESLSKMSSTTERVDSSLKSNKILVDALRQSINTRRNALLRTILGTIGLI